MFEKPGVILLSWMREVLETILAPGIAGAVLIRVAHERSRNLYPIAPRMVTSSQCIVLKEKKICLVGKVLHCALSRAWRLQV